ncbi:uncharacterized protein LOC124437408 [Xenia sp. Carnegie-2017]|uniref:uncharacterized protein LOC124437408 n=1 Tax=Xenia sp. Carnegie-2017 TaxID=2897299 RepID=UPI001F0359A3|nr:uncharacterized protein LOC124437408 [Xenia sp. Carnegie-2017]
MKIVGNELKAVWGKKLPVVVPKTSNYRSILDKAVEKYKAFDRKFDDTQEHILVYEDGSHAQLMPGTKDFFQLDNYKVEIGKDFKRITMYLCTLEDHNISEGIFDQFNSHKEDKLFDTMYEEDEFYQQDSIRELCNTEESERVCEDAKVAQKLQYQLDTEAYASPLFIHKNPEAVSSVYEKILKDPVDVVKKLGDKVDAELDQFFLVVRRGISLTRLLSLWQREAKKTPITRIFRVRIIGEDGIDSGAMAKEFLEKATREIEKIMFPDGFPVDSTLHVQNSNYHTCGEIAAVSMAQGGPPPCFLDEATFDMMVKGVDIHNIKASDLSPKEHQLIKQIESSCEDYVDTILEHGYTGPVNKQNIEAIVGSIKVSLLNRRTLYMNEFLGGMKAYGLPDLIKNDPEACKPLFVNGNFKKTLEPDANYLLSIINPMYSEDGSSRKKVEESIIDFFQDTLLSFDDGRVSGYKSAVAWNYDHELGNLSANQTIPEIESLPSTDNFESPDLSVAGIMQWITGQWHKPVGGEKFGITVLFDHECMQRNPQHTVCFPRVGACAKEITFPTCHMQTEKEFIDLFLLAYCKGQAFAKP